ncbi:AfsR/SARP family transcriptional regulator [Micromonospora lupini]|uniref:AfsR/SARP family transcriptional regulator n=1 Tax=Micromonospora lupini TaxID=285679 RepID=UPI0022524ACF|nr:AfsR/SARP family transcriptional regulator [Micromonospora lupini]MCX5065914.1 AfsR/SARP family transcriptional regulator [Micromonospora lupini]
MYLDVLGGLRIGPAGGDAGPTAPKQRQLLGLLALRAGATVPVTTCVRELWDDHPPRSAATTLQTYVMHLRRVLAQAEAPARLLTGERGYLLRIDPEQTDLGVVREWARRGDQHAAAGRPAHAAHDWQQALTLWRGPVLADVRVGPVAEEIIGHLDQWRLLLIDRYLEAELRCGRHRQVVAAATTLAGRHPLREPIHASLMTALYRSGRQADAVLVYQRLCAALGRELGVEPSAAVQRLHRAVRSGAAWLESPADPTTEPPVPTFRRPTLVPAPSSGVS